MRAVLDAWLSGFGAAITIDMITQGRAGRAVLNALLSLGLLLFALHHAGVL